MIGCTAGFLNVPKIKGTHNAMKSGMLAAESAIEAIIEAQSTPSKTKGLELKSYTDKIQNSWIYKELKAVRNFRPSFHTSLGLYGGMAYSGFSMLLGGREPWTLSHGGMYLYIGKDHNYNIIFNLIFNLLITFICDLKFRSRL